MILRLQNINTYYGLSHILFDVSLEVGAGEVAVLLGRNGVGKTTTLRSIIGLTPPRTGKVEFKGEDVTHFPPYRLARSGLAFVPEDRRIFPEITVEDNLLVSQRACGTKKVDWTLKEIYRKLSLHGREEKYPGNEPERGTAADAGHRPGPHFQPRFAPSGRADGRTGPLDRERNRGPDNPNQGERHQHPPIGAECQFALALAERGYILEKGRVRAQASGEELRQNREMQRKYLGVEKTS